MRVAWPGGPTLGQLKGTPFEPKWRHTIYTDYNFSLVQEPLAHLRKGVQTLQFAKTLKQFKLEAERQFQNHVCKAFLLGNVYF